MEWTTEGTLIYGRTLHHKITKKYACFDLDHTLIKSKSGDKFISNKKEWKYVYDTIPHILHQYDNDNFQIVIITNQAGINRFGIENWKSMLNDIQLDLRINLIVYVAISYDLYRKPFPTIWDNLIMNKDYDVKESFYCGDACGRENDFSDSDLKFALNCNLYFRTPENVFLNDYNVCIYPNFNQFKQLFTEDIFQFIPNEKEIILLIGNYASGKSTFIKKHLSKFNYNIIGGKGYQTINNDLNALLLQNKRIVIDDTNGTIKSRQKYIMNAKKYAYTIRCIYLICPIWLVAHNVYYRHYASKGQIKLIADSMIENFKDTFEYPTIDEGFDEIIKYYFTIDKYVNGAKYFMFFF